MIEAALILSDVGLVANPPGDGAGLSSLGNGAPTGMPRSEQVVDGGNSKLQAEGSLSALSTSILNPILAPE